MAAVEHAAHREGCDDVLPVPPLIWEEVREYCCRIEEHCWSLTQWTAGGPFACADEEQIWPWLAGPVPTLHEAFGQRSSRMTAINVDLEVRKLVLYGIAASAREVKISRTIT